MLTRSINKCINKLINKHALSWADAQPPLTHRALSVCSLSSLRQEDSEERLMKMNMKNSFWFSQLLEVLTVFCYCFHTDGESLDRK